MSVDETVHHIRGPHSICPEYKRKVICGKLREEIGKILRGLCERKEVEIIGVNARRPHPYAGQDSSQNVVLAFMGYLKGKSTLIIFERHANMKYRYGNRHFWYKGYYVSTVGANKEAIKKYIQSQMTEDI